MITETLLVLTALTLAYQDFKARQVSLWLMIAFGLLSLALFWNKGANYIDLALNLGYLLFWLGLSLLAIKLLKNESFNKIIGSGDILFLLLLAPQFAFESFALLIVVLMISSLLLHLVLQKVFRSIDHANLPLVGYMGIFYSAIMVYQWL